MSEEATETIESATAVTEPTVATEDGSTQAVTPDPEAQRSDNDWNWFQQRAAKEDALPGDDAPTDAGDGTEAVQAGDESGDATSGADTKADGDDAAPPEGFDEALEALTKELPADQIKAWYEKDPEGFIKHGQKRAKVQKDVARLIGERGSAAAKQQTPQTAEPGTEAQRGTEAPQPPRTVVEALKASLDDVLDSLASDELHADLREPLGIAFTKVGEQLSAHYEGLLQAQGAEYQQRAQHLQSQLVETQLDMSRAALADKYPSLKDDAAYQRVLERYDTLVASNKFGSVREAFTEAAKWHFSDENPANQITNLKNEMLKRNQHRKSGTPKARTPSNAETRMTPEQRENLIFDRLFRQHHGEHAA